MAQLRADLTGLNEAQQRAVTSENKRILVLAGAGSGKTKTLIQRLIYLTDEKEVSPYNILAITFTRNAAYEMTDRLLCVADSSGEYEKLLSDKQNNGEKRNTVRKEFTSRYKWIQHYTLKTFHSLCYQILRKHGVLEFDNQFRIVSDQKTTYEDFYSQLAPETTFEIYHKLLIEACSDQRFLLKLKHYLLDYLVDKIHVPRKTPIPQYTDGKFYTTLRNEKVRSKSEQYIADWLYRHNIGYQYEPVVNFKDFDFKPDFYIPAADIFLEHLSDKSYKSVDKEEQYNLGGRTCVKTFEGMANDTQLFNAALERIFQKLRTGSHTPAHLHFEEEFKSYHDHLAEFIRQVIRIMDMMKVENIDAPGVRMRAANDQHERVRTFYELAMPLIDRYHAYCVNKSYLDFNDLILRTIELFRNQPDIARSYIGRYNHILVDEFQDVNNLQVELIRLMTDNSSSLFCVGDDWQSIYGFRGSNVEYIVEFEKHFPGAQVITLNMNYRSSENIVDASNEVIRRNKYIVNKEVRANKASASRIEIFVGDDETENTDFLVGKIRELLGLGISGDEILVLYRRNKMYDPYFRRLQAEKIRINAKTIHAAKGLEAQYVFIIGLTEGTGGFPDVWLEDRLFQVVKQNKIEMLLEEERRLFYVALTRAKDQLYLITQKGNESSFLREIPPQYTVRMNVPVNPASGQPFLCPACNQRIDTDSVFCKRCGVQLSKINPPDKA